MVTQHTIFWFGLCLMKNTNKSKHNSGYRFVLAHTSLRLPLNSISVLSERRRLITSSKGALLIMKKRFVRQDWCQTEPLKQKIKEEGCITRTIINRFCYGQCNSFYIPKHSRKKKRSVDCLFLIG